MPCLLYTRSTFALEMYYYSLFSSCTRHVAPGYSREVWTSVKDTIGLDFPNVG